MAVRLATTAGLSNAATAEFLFDGDRRFWFLEVNTRLQVEHGVTELVSDIDIVREQFRIAAGWPLAETTLAAAARAADPERHAIEVRLAAEDPARDFAPAPGRIGRWVPPSGPGVRVDAAVEAGERVPADYDPMIAKLMVVDHTRDAAIDRLARSLDEWEVSGIQTTLPFHRFAAAHPAFRAARLSTDWVADHWDGAQAGDRQAALEVACRIAAEVTWAAPGAAAAVGAAPAAAVPSSSDPGWRIAARAEAVDRWPR